jgi:hypothetical protein
VPSLDLRFADNKSLVDAVTGASLVTFTRASSGTVTDSAGVIQTAATDVPRFDHNPTTGESLGLLVEEQRTNSIRNNTMVGAVAGTPGTLPTNWAVTGLGTLTREIVGTGTVNGINYVDIRFSGTTSTTQLSVRFDSANAIAAANGQTWTFSWWQSIVAGSTTNLTPQVPSILLFDATVAFLGGVGFTAATFNSTSIFTRQSGSGLIATANTAFAQPQINLLFASGVAIDITLRIGLPQLEQGAFATSPIPTTTAAVTRSADVASITGSAFSSWANNNEGTMFSDSLIIASGIKTQLAWSLTGGLAETNLRQPHSTATTFRAVIGGVFTSNTGSTLSSSVTRAAVAYSGTAGRLQVGSASNEVTGSANDAISLFIGSLGGSSQLNGTIKRLCFWPQRLANSTLQAITQ